MLISILKLFDACREAWDSIVVVGITNHSTEAGNVVRGDWSPREEVVFAKWWYRHFPFNLTTHLLQMRHKGSGNLFQWHLKKD